MFSLSLLFSNTILSFGQECKLGKGMFGLGRFLLNITQEPLLAVDKKIRYFYWRGLILQKQNINSFPTLN